ncbi:MAG: hypothetical protein WBP89_01435, partial [Sedimenticolaceae bacterium]
MNRLLWSFAFLLVFGVGPASAEVLVLVHGYLGTANSWVESGVLDRLTRRGYQHRGVLTFGPQ